MAQSISQAAAKINVETEEDARAIVLALFRAVIKDTAVDTGRARGNWQATKNAPATETLPVTDKQGSSTVAKTIPVVKDPGVYFLTNNLPYALRLEYGWSNQSPQGMVRKNLRRIDRIMEQATR